MVLSLYMAASLRRYYPNRFPGCYLSRFSQHPQRDILFCAFIIGCAAAYVNPARCEAAHSLIYKGHSPFIDGCNLQLFASLSAVANCKEALGKQGPPLASYTPPLTNQAFGALRRPEPRDGL